MAPPKPKNSINSKEQSLDLAALAELVEPLTVQIDRVKHGQRSPIPLPVNPMNDQPSGVGWSKEEIQAIEQGWLVNDWAGGGLYIGKVTDSSTPARVIEWRMFWNPADYPEKIPPTLAGAASPHLHVVPPPPQAQQVQSMASPQFPAGLPSGGLVPQQAYQQAPQYAYQPPQLYAPQVPYQPAANYAAQAQQQRAEDELNRMREALNQQRLEAQAREHAAALERERTANQAAIQRLEQRIAELATANARPPAPTGPSPELLEMREQMRAQQAQMENERRERDSERREALIRDQMREQAAATQRSIDAIQAQMATQLAALSNKGTDPMIQMMMEQNRNFTAALGEVSRNAQATSDKFQAFMMSPRDIIAMQKDSSNGLDGLTNKLTSVYSNVMDMQQRVIENAMQLNQGGSETVGLIREGITSVKEGFERYVGSKSKAEQVTQQSNAQTATANAQAAAIQAQAQVEIERLRTMGPIAAVQPQQAPRPVQQPTPPANTNGLNGASTRPGSSSFEEWQRQQATAQVANEASVAAQVPVEEPKYYGRTTLEWFTQIAIGEVKAVRDGVDVFIAGLKAGRMEGATPEMIVSGIMQANAMAAAQGFPIPAFVELMSQSKYEEFVNVLIPNAPETYRTDVVKMLREKIDGDVLDDEDEDEDDGDGEDEDDDGMQSDDVRDGSSVPQIKSKPALVRTPSA